MKQNSYRPFFIIVGTFTLTVIAGLLYLVYLIKTVPESSTIAIPFAFVFGTGFVLFFECIFFAVIFFKKIKQTWSILLPVFILTSMIPFYFLNKWYEGRPIKVPAAGKLPVSSEQYNLDTRLLLEDYKTYDLDTNNINIYQDSILSTKIDTIIYNQDKTMLFAIIITEIKDTSKYRYGNEYRIGRKSKLNWEYNEPNGNIVKSRYETISELKSVIRQYFYKKYSINRSSEKPEIWNDDYIFSFIVPREKYSDRRKNAL